ncbi:MAG: tetraacyldisaccharide 4'-kinase, partial [Myxococcales bacterium]|nr:tetraacyldisaccharide 4'-kinase [Myxococcales bacterium]
APAPRLAGGRAAHRATYEPPELWRDGVRRDARALDGARVGLVTALARPERVARHCARLGLAPVVVVRAPDHGPRSRRTERTLSARGREHRVDAWITTEKCALSLHGALAAIGAGSSWVLRTPLSLDAEVVRVLATLAALTVPRRSQ